MKKRERCDAHPVNTMRGKEAVSDGRLGREKNLRGRVRIQQKDKIKPARLMLVGENKFCARGFGKRRKVSSAKSFRTDSRLKGGLRRLLGKKKKGGPVPLRRWQAVEPVRFRGQAKWAVSQGEWPHTSQQYLREGAFGGVRGGLPGGTGSLGPMRLVSGVPKGSGVGGRVCNKEGTAASACER